MTSKFARATETDAIVQRLWTFCNLLKDDGVSYTDYVEQLTYLLFLKMEDERGSEKRIPAPYRWPELVRRRGIELEAHYLDTLQTLGREPGLVGDIFNHAQNRVQDPAKLKRLVGLIDAESWSVMDTDVKGAIYEGLLEKNAEDVKSGAGQYFTPRPLVRAIVEVMGIRDYESVCDPACGTGGFLLEAYRLASGKRSIDGGRYVGREIVPATARLCLMNVHLQGIPEQRVEIRVGDALVTPPTERFDVVLSNPPFGRRSNMLFTNEEGREDRDALTYHRRDFVATTSNKQLNFLQHIMSLLSKDGRAAVVVPDNVLFEAGAGETIRRALLETCNLHTILRLPPGIFYAGSVKANVLFFERKMSRTKASQVIWIYDLRTGHRFSLRGNPLAESDLEEFVSAFGGRSRRRIEESRFRSFSKAGIIASDRCSLDIGLMTSADPDELPAPETLTAEIVERLLAAVAAVKAIEDELT